MLEKLKSLLKPSVSIEVKLTGISLFIGRTLDDYSNRIIKLESRQLQKGDKGEAGLQGKAGKDGKDGKDGLSGLNGKDGKDGSSGKDGKQGISITETYFAPDGHLMVRLSSGKEIDAGSPNEMEVGSKGHIINTQVAKDQIYVSTTAPANPQLNQLWYDIT